MLVDTQKLVTLEEFSCFGTISFELYAHVENSQKQEHFGLYIYNLAPCVPVTDQKTGSCVLDEKSTFYDCPVFFNCF